MTNSTMTLRESTNIHRIKKSRSMPGPELDTRDADLAMAFAQEIANVLQERSAKVLSNRLRMIGAFECCRMSLTDLTDEINPSMLGCCFDKWDETIRECLERAIQNKPRPRKRKRSA